MRCVIVPGDLLLAAALALAPSAEAGPARAPAADYPIRPVATGFGEDQWFSTLKRTLRMDELITKHAAIMDKAEAAMPPSRRPGGDKKIGLVVDEWGDLVRPGARLEARLPLPAELAREPAGTAGPNQGEVR